MHEQENYYRINCINGDFNTWNYCRAIGLDE